jgi:hypothetical protein
MADHLRKHERLERLTVVPRARALHRDLGGLLSIVGRVLDLRDRGIRFGAGTARVFDRELREKDRTEEPLSVDDGVTIDALLNINWMPSSSGFLDCMAALSSVAAEARENLERKFPRLMKGKPLEGPRRERVRYLAPHLKDREIAVLEGLGKGGADAIRKDRQILLREDEQRSRK